MARHHRVDLAVDLRDLAVRLADRERPVRGPPHHHALEDGLTPDRSCHQMVAAMGSWVRGTSWPLWGAAARRCRCLPASVTTRRPEAHAPDGGPLAGRWPVRERARRVRSRIRTREPVAVTIFYSRIGLAATRAAGALEPPLEALDASTRVQQLLLARVEGMAVRADLDVQLGLRRARLELVAARAANGGGDVFGMEVGLHGRARIAAAVSPETLPPETTATTVSPLSSGIFPTWSAATAAAPAGSQASFARS